MLWQICPPVCRLSVVCDVHIIRRGFNLSVIFLHHILAWPPGNSPTKNHEDCRRGSPLRANLSNRRVAVRLLEDSQINRKGVVKQANLTYRRILVYHQVTFGYLIP